MTARVLRYLVGVLGAGTFLCSAVACDRELTPEETSFYERAREVKVGVTLETLKRQLGEPSRIVDAESHCASKGGRKEWVYDSFEAAGRRKRLSAGTFAFCADANGVVVAVFDVVV
jgi:hypothetical protein